MSEQTMADFEGQLDAASPWNTVSDYLEKKTRLTVKVEGIVNGGVIAHIEGLRGFIPASRLSLTYVEDLNIFLGQELIVLVIDVDQANNKLVLSAREALKDAQAKERQAALAAVEVGSVTKGTVETIQSYGAFVRLENALSGLVHISQISHNRIKSAESVLKVGQEVDVKITAIKDGKISLSMKALIPNEEEEEVYEAVEIPVAEELNTNLGDLFKNIKL